MANERDVMFWLVKSSFFGEKLDKEQINNITANKLQKAYDIASAHYLSQLFLSALKCNGLTQVNPDITRKAKKAVYFASITSSLQQEELEKVSKIFETNKIAFIPLKGSVIRKYYPEPWMRVSCDVDILVKPSDFEKAYTLLINELQYTSSPLKSHDISLHSKNSIHIELHYDLIEQDRRIGSSAILRNIWDYAHPKNEGSFEHALTDEVFYFYHIAHMEKHFEEGGCGIRSFLDLYVLNKSLLINREKLELMFKTNGMLKFANVSNQIVESWFEDSESNLPTEMRDVADFVVDGMVFGTIKTNTAMASAMSGKSKNILNLFFLPYNQMVAYYPILKKAKWLLPFCWMYRPIKAILQGRGSFVQKRIKAAGSIEQESIDKTKNIINYLELKE
ncbi:MAG: nucleotidyltransferase family protein [Clostridiales bacterium]|nr:nucleotidyltransferase family protein [Candidatus Equinaster intestinalis]